MRPPSRRLSGSLALVESSAVARSGTVRLGPELEVRRLAFGAMRVTGKGIWGDPPDPEQAKALLSGFGVPFRTV